MTGDYQTIKQFIQEQILDKNLDYNHLEITRSPILAITRGFAEKGWKVEDTTPEDSRFKQHSLTAPDGSETLSMLGGKVFRHPTSTEQICRRKHLTKRMLNSADIPTPTGSDFAFDEREIAAAFFNIVPKPAVVKVSDSGGSQGVTVGISTREEFYKAWDYALADGRSTSNVLVEEFVSGIELRAFVVGTNVVSVVARLQPFVVGDGLSTVSELITDFHKKREVHYRAMKMPAKIDWHFIDKQGADENHVLPSGEILFLNPFNTPTVRALVLDVSDSVNPKIKDIAKKAKDAIPGLEIAGVDLLVDDLSDEKTAHVLEVNTAAALELHRYPTHGGGARFIEHDIVDHFHNQFLAKGHSSVNTPVPDKTIEFRNLQISKTRVSFLMRYERGEFEIWYEFDREIETTPSLVAVAAATLCGTAFDSVIFDFEISAQTLEAIRLFTEAEVSAPVDQGAAFSNSDSREGTILSFSGGFDSIAAKSLLPENTHLVSLDLGGWFKREAEYFGRYSPITIKTNFRQVPDQQTALTRNHWLFMASGAILCSDHLNARHHVFGQILGERFSFPAAERRIPLLEAVGLEDVPITSGITELGTTNIMLQTHYDEVADSLVSLANNGDRKQYYKQAMVALLSEELGLPNPVTGFRAEWDRKIPFDRSYTSALSTLYFVSRGRTDLIEPLYESIPQEVLEFSQTLSLDFMTKVNTDFYEWTPKVLRTPLFSKLSELNLLPYTESDWHEVQRVRDFLTTWFR